MKIAILTFSPGSYSLRRLRVAAEKRGHVVKIYNTLDIALHFDSESPQILHNGKPLHDVEVLIPRLGATFGALAVPIVRQFERLGVFSLNSAASLSVAIDKLCTLQALSQQRLPFPTSEFLFNSNDIQSALTRVGNAPTIIKLLSGTQGLGVMLAESEASARSILETMQATRSNVLLQRFVKESKGRDIRAFVVGGRVLGAIRRTAQGDEFRSNFHRGATVEQVQLSPQQQHIAIAAAAALELHVAGVDMLEGSDGPLITELNASPGLEGIERATRLDIAGEIITYLEGVRNQPAAKAK